LFALACNVVLVISVFRYCRAHASPWLGTLLGSYLMVFGAAAGRTALVPLVAVFPLAIASLPMAFLQLERATARADAAAMGVLLLALGFGGPIALPICCGVGLWLLLRRPRRPWRLLIPGIPLCIYLIALIAAPSAPAVEPPGYPTATALPPDLLAATAFFSRMVTSVGAAMGGYAESASHWVPLVGLLLVAAGAILTGTHWRRLEQPARERVAAYGVVLLGVWTSTSLARAKAYGLDAASSPRDLIIEALPILLILSEVFAVMRHRARTVFTLLVATAACLNGVLFVRAADSLHVTFEFQRARAAALEAADTNVPPDYYPRLVLGQSNFGSMHTNTANL
jgi:hypothetical protein